MPISRAVHGATAPGGMVSYGRVSYGMISNYVTMPLGFLLTDVTQGGRERAEREPGKIGTGQDVGVNSHAPSAHALHQH